MDIIIPIFNRPPFTEACLNALLSVEHGTDIRPIIVDNGCRIKAKMVISEWMEKAKPIFPGVAVVTLPSNQGFSAAINEGVKVADTKKTICVMHNDVIVVQDGWAGMLEAALNEDSDIAVAVPRTCYANEGSPVFPEANARFVVLKPPNKIPITTERICEIVTQSTASSLSDALKMTYPVPYSYCPEICSFCMAVKGGIFDEFGGFDEDFGPRGFEDKFWFRQIEREGLSCSIANHAYVHHFGNITSDGPGFEFPKLFKLGEEIFAKKCQEQDVNWKRKLDTSSLP
jgi:O-antigen biosynthesis protein